MKNNLLQQLENIQNSFIFEIEKANSLAELEKIRITYLGRKGRLKEIIDQLPLLSELDRKEVGQKFNAVRNKIQELLQKKEGILTTKHNVIFDFEIPIKTTLSTEHLLLRELRIMTQIFKRLGFSIGIGPEIVSEKFNFDVLNIPEDHPAREMQDTIWLTKSSYLFRTHTSSYQVPFLLKHKPPVKVIIPGKVFRYEATDRTHDFEFYQIEGLSVSQSTTLSQLAWNLEQFFQNYFPDKIEIRFRISYFPFVEPGLEVDISCPICQKKGCNVCKFTGFVEVAGAGMIHPVVLKNAKIDAKKYHGYAFGLGVERLVMLKYQISDIRILHGNKINYLGKFENEIQD